MALFILLANRATGQVYDTSSVFRMPIVMDTFVIHSGFDVNAFIRRVQNDSTFYKAFRTMHLVPNTAINDIKIIDKNSEVAASWHCRSQQHINKGCRTNVFIDPVVTGNFFKPDGDYRYYTATLYDYLFLTHKPVCNENDIVAGALETRGAGQMEKNKYELKQLIFNPGSKIGGIPFMGNRASIFNESEQQHYHFRIYIDTIEGTECYVFHITPAKGSEHLVVYNELTTWFRKSDYAILARNYSLSFSTLFYDFDVVMRVRTALVNGKLLPTYIDYDGNWHILGKKREHVKFSDTIYYQN